MMRLFGNILWIIFGGAEMALCWAVAALIFALSIVGLPWARSAATIAWFTIWPFGRYAVERETVTGEEDLGTGALGFVGNVIWFLLAGIWLAIGHVFTAALLALTIIGIPFAIQHLKIAKLALAPIGKTILDDDSHFSIQ